MIFHLGHRIVANHGIHRDQPAVGARLGWGLINRSPVIVQNHASTATNLRSVPGSAGGLKSLRPAQIDRVAVQGGSSLASFPVCPRTTSGHCVWHLPSQSRRHTPCAVVRLGELNLRRRPTGPTSRSVPACYSGSGCPPCDQPQIDNARAPHHSCDSCHSWLSVEAASLPLAVWVYASRQPSRRRPADRHSSYPAA